MAQRGRAALAMDCVLAGLESQRIRPLNSIVRRHLITWPMTGHATLNLCWNVSITKVAPTPPNKKFPDFVLIPDGDRAVLAKGAVPLR